MEREYKEGKPNGLEREYYLDGSLRQEGRYIDGKEEGIWKEYYPNGQVISEPNPTKVGQLMKKSAEKDKEGDVKSAIDYATKAIQKDSTYADAYFSRGTLELNELRFDEAIADLDKALIIEPFMEFALANRAFARIRKYQFAGSRSLSKNKDVDIRAAKDKVDIPPADVDKICSDRPAA